MNLSVFHLNKEGELTPVSIAYNEFFFGADSVATFESEEQLKRVFPKIKAMKNRMGAGKFVVVNLDRGHKFPVTTLTLTGSGVSHNHGGRIRRIYIRTLNGMPIADWVKHLKANKKLGIA